MKNIFFYFALLTILSSCIIQLNTGNSYDALNQDQKNRIVKLNSFETTDTTSIYEISGNQLKEELKKHDSSLVYTFVSGCTSKNCVPLSLVENYAQKNNLKLFLVLARYSNLEETLIQHPKNIIFSINAESYGTLEYNQYFRSFKSDLGYYDYPSGEKYPGSYIFFKGDSITSIKQNLLDK